MIGLGRTLSQFRLRLLGSYPLSVPSSILTIKPSQEALTDSSRKVWMSSSSWPSMEVAKENSPSMGWKALWRSVRRSRSGFSTTDSPFRYKRSKAKTHTLTLTSSILTSFFFLVISCWKGRTFFSTTSQATDSQSKTKLVVSSLTQVLSLARMSGYFLDKSSEFLEKMDATPPPTSLPAPCVAWLSVSSETLAT